MVSRSDNGVHMKLKKIPNAQEEIVDLCRHLQKHVVVASHLFASMTERPTPTRAVEHTRIMSDDFSKDAFKRLLVFDDGCILVDDNNMLGHNTKYNYSLVAYSASCRYLPSQHYEVEIIAKERRTDVHSLFLAVYKKFIEIYLILIIYGKLYCCYP